MITKLLIEYDGAPFAGWARQPDQYTVQGEIERALATISGQDLPITVAGRTDRGVHAKGQVASYQGEPVDIRRLNSLLPKEIAIRSSEATAENFDARESATSRVYCYRILATKTRSVFERNYSYHYPTELEFDLLRDCSKLLIGTHDFTAFTPTDTYHVRFKRDILTTFWRRQGQILEFWIEADAFMRHMNRILVGTMLEVASGKRTLDNFKELLTGKHRSDAGVTLPAHGLCLVAVGYGKRILIDEDTLNK